MDAATQWFQQRLSPRLDALQVLLQAIAAREADAEPTARRMARSLRDQAVAYGCDEVARASGAVAECSGSALKVHVQHLIRVLREEAARAQRVSTVILVVGVDPRITAVIRGALSAPDRDVTAADTAAEAQHVLREQDVALVVLNIVLPDADGRALLGRMRDSPLTASIPALVLAPKLRPSIREDDLALAADGIMEQPLDMDAVLAWIKARLRRAHETIREARRDLLTGLLNRAAFRESVGEAVRVCAESGVPLALGLISVDSHRAVFDAHGESAANEVLRRVALLLSASLRVTDVLGRCDVAKFAAIFPSEDRFGGARAVEKVIEKAARLRVEIPDGAAVGVTLSGGIASVSGPASPDELMAEAERYLFQSVSAGGNRVTGSQSSPAERSRRVLAVVGDALAGRVVEQLLEKEGLAVDLLTDGVRAIAEAEGHAVYHLIILDEKIAGPSGLEVLERLRGQARLNRVPILMLLARNAEDSMVRALELGANDYLARPLAPAALLNHVRRLLTRGGEAAAEGSEAPVILVVSDSTRDLLMVATALRERGGFRALLGFGGSDGLRRFEAERPDILLLDFDMSDMPGPEFMEALRRKTDFAHTRVVFASAAKDESAWKEYFDQGVCGVLPKPLDPVTLAVRIEEMLGMSGVPARALEGTEHLNAEILRVVRLGGTKKPLAPPGATS
ncbi:MAG: response regulator [Lentisphaerae bacterium]|nr:response regulator [Lentisphaerota bacterium]